jgi:hypothetical protein
MLPLREHFRGPPVELVIRVTEEDRADLGARPAERASEIVRRVLREERRKRRSRGTPQLRLGLVPRRRSART